MADKTLTSALVLSFLMAGSIANAMEKEATDLIVAGAGAITVKQDESPNPDEQNVSLTSTTPAYTPTLPTELSDQGVHAATQTNAKWSFWTWIWPFSVSNSIEKVETSTPISSVSSSNAISQPISQENFSASLTQSTIGGHVNKENLLTLYQAYINPQDLEVQGRAMKLVLELENAVKVKQASLQQTQQQQEKIATTSEQTPTPAPIVNDTPSATNKDGNKMPATNPGPIKEANTSEQPSPIKVGPSTPVQEGENPSEQPANTKTLDPTSTELLEKDKIVEKKEEPQTTSAWWKFW